MALVLKLREGDDVFVGTTQVVAQRPAYDHVVLAVQGRLVTVTQDDWSEILPGCTARVSRNLDSMKSIRVEFNAPENKVLRGNAYRRPNN